MKWYFFLNTKTNKSMRLLLTAQEFQCSMFLFKVLDFQNDEKVNVFLWYFEISKQRFKFSGN